MEKTKMRIKTLKKDGTLIKDRLVTQNIEFTSGPSEKHKGPINIEVTLRDQGDIDSFKIYLDKLTGDLPIIPKKVYKTKTSTALLSEEPIKDLLFDIKAKCKTQDDVIKFLRERNFVFVTHQFLEDRKIKIELEKNNHKNYQYLIRLIKEAKDPKANKYDPQLLAQLLVGIKFMETMGSKVLFYMYGKFKESSELPWSKKSDINFKKITLTKFPGYMLADEREKFRSEEAKLKRDPKLKPSKFFLRWKGPVDEMNSKAAE
jgi:hypothetical protein